MSTLYEELGHRSPNILFIKGVGRADFASPEECFENLIMDDLQTLQKKYDKIPYSISNINDWPRSTNIVCWQDGCEFSCRPVPIIFEIKERGGKLEYVMKHTVFCSIACGAKFITQNYIRDQQWSMLRNTKMFYNELTGKELIDVKLAPDRGIMVQYGGTKTPEEYHEIADGLN